MVTIAEVLALALDLLRLEIINSLSVMRPLSLNISWIQIIIMDNPGQLFLH